MSDTNELRAAELSWECDEAGTRMSALSSHQDDGRILKYELRLSTPQVWVAVWVASIEGAEIARGTLAECKAACEACERTEAAGAYLAANQPGPRCRICERPATCHGKYADEDEGFACDECCGHGCEDGFCTMLDDPPLEPNPPGPVTPCPLVHCPCGACGQAVASDGGCGCEDNRKHPVASMRHDLASRYLLAAQFAEQRLRELGDESAVAEIANLLDGDAASAQRAFGKVDVTEPPGQPQPVTPEGLAALGLRRDTTGQGYEFDCGLATLSVRWPSLELWLWLDEYGYVPIGTARTLADVAMGVEWLKRLNGENA